MVNNNPVSTLITYSELIIVIVCFLLAFCFTSIASPIPAFAIKPLMQAPKDNPLLTNKLVIITDDAQLGISPTSPVRKG